MYLEIYKYGYQQSGYNSTGLSTLKSVGCLRCMKSMTIVIILVRTWKYADDLTIQQQFNL